MRASNLVNASATESAFALVLGERKQGGRIASGYAGNNRVFFCHAATSEDDSLKPAASPKASREPRKFLTIPRSKLSARPEPARKAGLPNIGVLQAQPTGERARAPSQCAVKWRRETAASAEPTDAQARFRSLSVSRKHFANTAPAVDRSDAASASSAASRGEPRLKTSLTCRDAPSPTIFKPAMPAPERRQSA